MAGLYFHRATIVLLVPVAWALATVALLIAAPFDAAEKVWTSGVKKHWNAQ